MMDLEFLASAINEILGSKYCVYLKTNAAPSNIGSRTVVTMDVARFPYSFTTEEFDAENVTITLTFDLPAAQYGEDLVIRDTALLDIQTKLFGWRSFVVEQPIEEGTEAYNITAKFELQPSTNPYVDSGRKTQQIVVSGSAQIQNVNCGAVVGNAIHVSIDGVPLLKLEHASNMQVGADNNIPLSEDKTLPEMRCISRTATKNITFLYTGKEIEKTFLRMAEGIHPDVNREYVYLIEYPDFSIKQKIKIAGASSQSGAGIYLQYTLVVQVVEEEVV
jgi:hypothetical protein